MKRQLAHISAFLALTMNGLMADPCCTTLSPHQPCIKADLSTQANVYTQLSFLYWECGERGLDYALKNKGVQSDSDISVHKPVFKWDPAFRFILGYHLPIDNWKIDFSYSHFSQHLYNHVDDSADTLGRGILSVWTSPGAFSSQNLFVRWKEATAKWKIHANLFDLMLRHDLWIGEALSFQPAFGLKLALLQQRYRVFYAPGNNTSTQTFLSSTINMNNRSLNIGPGVGCGSRWKLSRHWNLFGSLSGALLGANFQVGRNEFDVSSTTETIIGSYRDTDKYWTYRPQGALVFGIQWGGCSCDKTSALHYALSASYEGQYWWKQNMLLRHYDAPIAQSHTMAPTQGDLFFQGLNIDLLFDF